VKSEEISEASSDGVGFRVLCVVVDVRFMAY
jgi:hypothetical protein